MKDQCVPVAINEHMRKWLAMTDGAEGEFIKANQHPSGGNCFVLTTADGKKLAGGNGPQGAKHAVSEGFKKWNRLSQAERRALPAGKTAVPPEVQRCTPPPGGLILRSYIRNLKGSDSTGLFRITAADLNLKSEYPKWDPIYTEPAHYTMWLTESEWKSLVPANARSGGRVTISDAIQKRLLRFHMVNGTFGLPGRWRLEDIRKSALTLTVEKTTPTVHLRLEGSALLASDANLDQAKRGYDAQVLGKLEFDPAKKAFTRMDIVVLGQYWGGDYEGGRFRRPGRTPLGIAFELVRGNSAVDLVPPLVHMDRKQDYDRYFAAERVK